MMGIYVERPPYIAACRYGGSNESEIGNLVHGYAVYRGWTVTAVKGNRDREFALLLESPQGDVTLPVPVNSYVAVIADEIRVVPGQEFNDRYVLAAD